MTAEPVSGRFGAILTRLRHATKLRLRSGDSSGARRNEGRTWDASATPSPGMRTVTAGARRSLNFCRTCSMSAE